MFCLPRRKANGNGLIEETAVAELTVEQLKRLDALEPAAGDPHDEARTATIDR